MEFAIEPNKAHLDILKQGPDVWNAWRENTHEQPILRGANLRGADLHGTDLRSANIVGANLSGAYLSSANLSYALLRGAKLVGTYLSNADLFMADLDRADLTDAHLFRTRLWRARLGGATLVRTDLSHADLHRTVLDGISIVQANMHRAKLGHTVFTRCQFKHVKGLEKIHHMLPSNLDHYTIAQSDPLPLSFLRGCGLPDLIIDNIEVLRGDPIQLYSCFISHSSENEDFARRLHADLQDEGVRCWFAPDNVKGGRKLHRQINEAIRLYDKLVLILSEASMSSNWVEHEIRQARKRERNENRRVLFPIRLVSYEALQGWTLFDADEGRDLAREIREYYIPDFSNWTVHDSYTEEFGKLIRDLRAPDQ